MRAWILPAGSFHIFQEGRFSISASSYSGGAMMWPELSSRRVMGTSAPSQSGQVVRSETVNQVAYGKERVLVTRHGKALVALVPVEDLELIEAMEDRID